jgi:hypothetical protein
MNIGETLTQARDRVGLSITDVSERTRIRETIIRDIEHDEFRSSGGDFYARGHIRAIARVVGADPAPLIEAYDETHEWSLRQETLRQGILGPDGSLHPTRPAHDDDAAESGFTDPEEAAGAVGTSGSSAGVADLANPGVALEQPSGTIDDSGPAGDPGPPRPDPVLDDLDAEDDAVVTTQQVPVYRLGSAQAPPTAREPGPPGSQAGTGEVPRPDQRTMRLSGSRLRPEGIAAFREGFLAGLAACVEAFRRAWERLRPQGLIRFERPSSERPSSERSGLESFAAWAKALRSGDDKRVNVAAVLALALLAAIGAIVYLLAAGPATPARPASVASSPRASHRHQAAGHSPSPGPTHPASGHTSTGTAATQAGPLQPAAAIAFGPGGAAQGDNPQLASQALGGKSDESWHTSWYTTAHFGGLQNGTGLLLDMGKNVTVTSAQLTLGVARGASLQLLAGNRPQMADLHPIATASDAGGGSLVLRPARPAQARYLLIWFTQLPPNHAGTYEAWISDIAVKGLV